MAAAPSLALPREPLALLRALRGGDEHQRDLLQAGEFQLGRERIRPRCDGEIGFVSQDLVHCQCRVAGLQLDLQLGITATKAFQYPGSRK